ncbi:hypothetical protein [Desulfotruncus alcoholivorax]|uniref:hypothetical protein n=1 Tax=Desulfotruncus alcoholivorax TaxID=265477 RepID=UPI0004156FA4|nr:hypothetical protein [Desulfotruncus alcoholivorax]
MIHGDKIYCCGCQKPVSHSNAKNSNIEPYFKTTGRGKSKHKIDCPEKREIKQIKTIKSLTRYTTNLNKINPDDFHVIKVALSKTNIDHVPHGEINEVSKDNSKKRLDYILRYSGNQKRLPVQISSLATIAKLLSKNSLKNLTKTFFDINGNTWLINQFIIDQNQAFEIAYSGNFYIPYFVVYGKVGSVKKLDKVMYINFDQQDGLKPFTAYVLSSYYEYFTYTKEQLEGNYVLIQGPLKFNARYNQAEIQIKWNKQLYIMK